MLDPDLLEMAEACWWNGISYGSFSDSAREGLINKFLVENPNISISQQEKTWLVENFVVFNELDKFLDSHTNDNTAVIVAKSYLGLLMSNNQEVLQLLNDMKNAQIGDPIWEIIKEQLALILTDIVADIVPGGMVITIGPELLQNLEEGKYMEAMWNAIDIALNEADTFFPPAKIASTTFSVIEKSVQLSKFYNAFKKMKTLGDDVVYRVYLVLRNKFDKLFSNMEWESGVGAKVTNFGDPLEIWDDIEAAFPDATILTPAQLQPQEIAGIKLANGTRIVIKFGGNTNPGGYSFEFKTNSGFTYKIRF